MMESNTKILQIEIVTENADHSGIYFTILDLPAMRGADSGCPPETPGYSISGLPFGCKHPGNP